MAPLTRFRASDAHIPLQFVVDYYAQRGSVPGTLLVTEATFISAKAGGYPNVPTLATDEALQAWKKVTDAVHAKGSYIFCQLWALGRIAIPKVLDEEKDAGADNIGLVSSSATPYTDGAPMSRELTEEEIQSFIGDYAAAAKAAVEVAGFDGVEIHGAGGYPIDQFTQDTCNRRTDPVAEAVGPGRIGIRLSPWSTYQGMRMQDPIPQFAYLIKGLKELKLAYLHLVESRICGNVDVEASDRLDFALDAWGAGKDNKSPVLIAGGYRPDSARTTVDEEYKDKNVGIVFGRFFISNPDLVFRLKKGIEFRPYEREKFYLPKWPAGYTDCEFSDEWKGEEYSKGIKSRL
ncbi:NADH:flavin oxidoreductase NADH oxidase family protein [Zopfia rhizophila CBS 207.26]|uniref:NADH:flavin oxidoreductase NADH oxidase family protein n=1 Tax=Zopfia rhizophila CBS 207.26 TaxID=1314779 RepID=A0A6A6DGK6_9PEZI|nr:NADH:flavin oxidoreductase NADH oxidase family protein [Zopfia rhizophila CBS 207.26]